MSKAPLKTSITREGQGYVDDAVMLRPKPVSGVDVACAKAFKRPLARPLLAGYERVPLRWMKPDGKGGLVPK